MNIGDDTNPLYFENLNQIAKKQSSVTERIQIISILNESIKNKSKLEKICQLDWYLENDLS